MGCNGATNINSSVRKIFFLYRLCCRYPFHLFHIYLLNSALFSQCKNVLYLQTLFQKIKCFCAKKRDILRNRALFAHKENNPMLLGLHAKNRRSHCDQVSIRTVTDSPRFIVKLSRSFLYESAQIVPGFTVLGKNTLFTTLLFTAQLCLRPISR